MSNASRPAAIVVGGGSGIGRAIATRFARDGYDVSIADVRDDVEAIANDVAADSAGQGRVVGSRVDATDDGQAAAAARRMIEEFGRCDCVVYAAGTASGQYGFPFWEVDVDRWPGTFEVNLFGLVRIATAFREALVASRGSLIAIVSVAGQMGSQTDPPYSAAKAGAINFVQCAAKDFAPFGARANAISPGMVQTPLNRNVYLAWAARQPEGADVPDYETWAGEKIDRVVPLKRWQKVEDIAAAAAFLASDDASEVTGQTLNVDGGFVMHS